MKQLLLAVMICIAIGVNSVSAIAQQDSPTAILGALTEEVMLLQNELTDAEEQYIQGIPFLTGAIQERPVVIARTGVGKVNAAMVTTLLIEHFQPGEIIVMGVAGGTNPDLLPGDVIIAERIAHHDLGSLTDQGMRHWGVRNPLNEQRNPVFFPGDSLLVAMMERAGQDLELEPVGAGDDLQTPRVIRGVIVTGDVFVASSSKRGQLRDDLRADAVEMEGAAVAQICWQRGVPCVIIRCLSDTADENAGRDYENFYQIAARNSARLVLDVIKQMALAPTPEGK
jgi:adenosylhomocysteine nucleosidase